MTRNEGKYIIEITNDTGVHTFNVEITKGFTRRFVNGYNNWNGKISDDVWVLNDGVEEDIITDPVRKDLIAEFVYRMESRMVDGIAKMPEFKITKIK